MAVKKYNPREGQVSQKGRRPTRVSGFSEWLDMETNRLYAFSSQEVDVNKRLVVSRLINPEKGSLRILSGIMNMVSAEFTPEKGFWGSVDEVEKFLRVKYPNVFPAFDEEAEVSIDMDSLFE